MTELPRLHVVTDDVRLSSADFATAAADVLEAGGSDVALHLRGRATSASRLYELARGLLPVARRVGARLLVNDRVDVALAARADGVQLREDSLTPADARAILGAGALVGVSRHADSVGGGPEADADFVVLGSVFATRSHPGARALGLDGLRAGAKGMERGGRLIAIGGIAPARVVEVVNAGAYGVAVSSGIWDSGGTVAAALKAYLGELRAATAPR